MFGIQFYFEILLYPGFIAVTINQDLKENL